MCVVVFIRHMTLSLSLSLNLFPPSLSLCIYICTHMLNEGDFHQDLKQGRGKQCYANGDVYGG